MMQAATDVFLGWTRTPIDNRYFYIRRLKDSRLANIGTQLQAALPFYASLCGRTLARAHARAGDAALVAGYAGSGSAFEEAIGGDQRVCRGLWGPDREGLERLPGGNQGSPHRRDRAGNEVN
jgi:hypothetical protein